MESGPLVEPIQFETEPEPIEQVLDHHKPGTSFDDLKKKVGDSDLLVVSESALKRYRSVDLEWLYKVRERIVVVPTACKVAVIHCRY